jgi:hypothetical protein
MDFKYLKSLIVNMSHCLTFGMMLNNFGHIYLNTDPIRRGGRSWQSGRPKASASMQW